MQGQYTKPFYMFFLILPMGISQGFVTVALPFLLSKNGVPVALTASIVAIGLSANLWRFVWGPVVDLSLSLHKWFWLSLLVTIASLLLLCFIPFTQKGRSFRMVPGWKSCRYGTGWRSRYMACHALQPYNNWYSIVCGILIICNDHNNHKRYSTSERQKNNAGITYNG